MMQIEWTKDLNTGVAEIDSQHQRLVALNNQLDRAIASKNDDMIREVLHAMIDYTKTHFSYEENLLKLAKYPKAELIAHQKKHALFVEKLDDIAKQFSSGEAVARRLQILLRNWLLHHIKQEDQDYVPWVDKYLNPEAKNLSPVDLLKQLWNR